ncbi:hypothetical protein [Amantichitinum ursilacus]|uniref:Uncharacterized protein n=1 Tax=Amantichitinum ursilacus TaxID=857265 RepID=A0A0N0GM63_9NEIS|nr:hypothetical protein [Amantichitinum ursilacus]KPC50665.1 hypothetical protein WG78_16465 [Amantichitinum ursilacus]
MMEAINFSRPTIERLIKGLQAEISQLNPVGLDDRIELGACNNLIQALGGLSGSEFVLMCVDAVDAPVVQDIAARYNSPQAAASADHMSLFYGSNESSTETGAKAGRH